MQSPEEYLRSLERPEQPVELRASLLWPRTPIGDEIQAKIRERVGVPDTDASDARSRPARINFALDRLVRRRRLPADFTVLDIACGDALILTELKRRFPEARLFGIDINVGAFSQHAEARRAGVALFRVLIQDLVTRDASTPFDVVLMLNTYRSWAAADLSERDQGLPALVDRWLAANARRAVLTMGDEQVHRWRKAGFDVADLGRGEEDSRLVCMSRDALPRLSRRLPLRTSGWLR